LVPQRFEIAPTLETWGMALGTGALAFTGLLFLARGLQFEPAGSAASVRLLDVALLFAWDLALLDVSPNAWSYAGAAAVCLGVALLPFRKLRGHWAIKRGLRARLGL
jgi:drug/metabolite transporter (DMT)-like permease